MLPKQMVELAKDTYQIMEEIGHGASSRVYLVQRCSKPLIQLPTQSTNLRPVDSTLAQHQEDSNPDLAKLDELINQARKRSLGESSVVNESNSSFLVENGRQNTSLAPIKEAEAPAEMFALKTVIIESENVDQRKKEKEYWKEVEMLGRLRHPGIIQVIDHGTSVRDGKRELHLLTQLGKGGNFLRFLDTVAEAAFSPRDNEAIFKHCISQIVEVVDYLQSMGVSHRDLKAENFILDERYCLKLIDFGAAEQFLSEGENEEERGYIGTKYYISPQMIDRSRHSNGRQHYSKSDVWSLGVLIYFVFTRRYPFAGANTYCILENIKNREPDLTYLVNPHLRHLLGLILKKNPAERISIRQIKQYPYFADVDFATVFTKESPYCKLIEEPREESLFRQEIVVRINGQAKRRVIALTRKSSSNGTPKKEPIIDRMCSLSNIDIKKNISENTEIHSSNKIDSSVSLDLPQGQKNYLSISKIGLVSQPKLLELLPSTSLSVNKSVCRLNWKETDNTLYEDYPQSVELKFDTEEALDAFVSSFQRIQEGNS